MYRLDIYVAKKDGAFKRVRNVAMNIKTFEEADRLCEQKNKDLGAGEFVAPGHKFAMFDEQDL